MQISLPYKGKVQHLHFFLHQLKVQYLLFNLLEFSSAPAKFPRDIGVFILQHLKKCTVKLHSSLVFSILPAVCICFRTNFENKAAIVTASL